jgi:hypothetical protein
MKSDLLERVQTLLTCGHHFSTTADAYGTLRSIAFDIDDEPTLAKQLTVPPATIRGLVMQCGYSVRAFDWLSKHRLPHTKPEFINLRDSLIQNQPDNWPSGQENVELYLGAAFVLNIVDWNHPTF